MTSGAIKIAFAQVPNASIIFVIKAFWVQRYYFFRKYLSNNQKKLYLCIKIV